MKHKAEHDQLLEDVLAEAAPASFRQMLLEQTLRAVRHRKRARRWRICLLWPGLLLGLAVCFWSLTRPKPEPSSAAAPPPIRVVNSSPLNPSMLVATKRGPVEVITGSEGTVPIIVSQPAEGSYREVDDSELLALLDGRPAALVRHQPHAAQLILIDPADQSGFEVP